MTEQEHPSDGVRLREIRIGLKLPQRAFGKKLGKVSGSYVSQMESGRKPVPVWVRERAEAIRLSGSGNDKARSSKAASPPPLIAPSSLSQLEARVREFMSGAVSPESDEDVLVRWLALSSSVAHRYRVGMKSTPDEYKWSDWRGATPPRRTRSLFAIEEVLGSRRIRPLSSRTIPPQEKIHHFDEKNSVTVVCEMEGVSLDGQPFVVKRYSLLPLSEENLAKVRKGELSFHFLTEVLIPVRAGFVQFQYGRSIQEELEAQRVPVTTTGRLFGELKPERLNRDERHIAILRVLDDLEFATMNDLIDRIDLTDGGIDRRLVILMKKGIVTRDKVKIPGKKGVWYYSLTEEGEAELSSYDGLSSAEDSGSLEPDYPTRSSSSS